MERLTLALPITLSEATKRLTLHVLVHTNHNVTRAANLLGCGRRTLRLRMAKWGLPLGDLTALKRALDDLNLGITRE